MSSCCQKHDKSVVQPDKTDLLTRLARIEGQVRGISGMIDNDRYCIDVLTQIAAVKSAMDAVAMKLLRNHVTGCVVKAAQEPEGEVEGLVAELIDVVKKIR